jgi:hypothetical protein
LYFLLIIHEILELNLLEIYLICKYKPCINKDDVPKDDLTIHLPEPRFYPYWDKIIDKWKEKQIEQLIDTSTLGSPFEDDFYFF